MVPAALSLILLDLGPDPAEDRLAEELQLAGIDVRWAPAPDGFVDAPLARQLDAVRPTLAGTTAWLVPDADVLHLSVAFVEAERAVVRVVDAPRGDEARLALTARELVVAGRGAPIPEPIVPAPEPAVPEVAEVPEAPEVGWQLGLVGISSILSRPRPRGGVELEIGDGIGLAVGLHIGGGGELRTTGSVYGRWQRLRMALGADVVRLPWVLWVQPRAELGFVLPIAGGWFAEPRFRGTFLRDRIERGDTVLYDSGWAEAGIVLGWRQIPGSR